MTTINIKEGKPINANSDHLTGDMINATMEAFGSHFFYSPDSYGHTYLVVDVTTKN